jgi:hypothetical protein
VKQATVDEIRTNYWDQRDERDEGLPGLEYFAVDRGLGTTSSGDKLS